MAILTLIGVGVPKLTNIRYDKRATMMVIRIKTIEYLQLLEKSKKGGIRGEERKRVAHCRHYNYYNYRFAKNAEESKRGGRMVGQKKSRLPSHSLEGDRLT